MSEFVRFSKQNDNTCDYAHRDYYAGLHKHVLSNDKGNGLHICNSCGRAWEITEEEIAGVVYGAQTAL